MATAYAISDSDGVGVKRRKKYIIYTKITLSYFNWYSQNILSDGSRAKGSNELEISSRTFSNLLLPVELKKGCKFLTNEILTLSG